MEHDQAALALAALGNPARLDIYRTLMRSGQRGLNIGDIQARIDMPRSTLNHHLHKLIEANLVAPRKKGTSVVCCAEFGVMQDLIEFLFATCCADEASLNETVLNEPLLEEGACQTCQPEVAV
ncbi:MAG: metalloregulator ArsR/SmtB family transcription factor [Deinococcota bacterium]